MTSTTQQPITPWPTRREREGGPSRRAASPARRPSDDRPVTADRPVTERPVTERPVTERAAAAWTAPAERPAAYVPRHAAAEPAVPVPDVTDRLPIVVPEQRSGGAAPTPTAAAGTDAARDEAVVPGDLPEPAPGRPTATPRPPRPAVGSAGPVAPEIRPSRNGLGVAAARLGAIGIPLGLVPVTGFVAAGLGVLALVFGIAGWSRVRTGTASNRGAAVTGAVLGLIALGLGVAGTIAFVRAPDRLVYDLDALTAASTSATLVTPAGE